MRLLVSEYMQEMDEKDIVRHLDDGTTVVIGSRAVVEATVDCWLGSL